MTTSWHKSTPESELSGFTLRARKAFQLATQESQRLGHDQIGTEHVLLGLLKDACGVAVLVLNSLEVDLKRARAEVEAATPTQPVTAVLGSLPRATETQQLVENATAQAKERGHSQVGTGHILLALLADPNTKGHQILAACGLSTDVARTRVVRVLESLHWEKLEGTYSTKKRSPSTAASASLREKLDLFNSTLPLQQASTIPSLWYFDPEIYAAECRAVFGGTWQAVGRSEQVAEPGSFVTAEVAGEPILVVRGSDGALRGFLNICRHRAACVMNESAGKASRLRCRYHGWTYDLAGRLLGTPEFEGVADFRREDNGLVPVSVDTWGPLVFVHLGENPQPLAEFLAPLQDRAKSLSLESLRFVERREYELRCNWKVFVDNYLDGGYHVNTVHPGLAGVLDYSQYRTEISGNTAVQSSPISSPSTPPFTPDSADTSISRVRTGTAYYWWVFPNFMLNIYSGIMDTNVVLPLGPDRCRVIFDFYFAETAGDSARRFIAESIAVAEQVQQEDVGICEEVQRGLGSRSYSTGRFSVRREAAVYHFHRLLAHHVSRVASSFTPHL